MTAISALVSVIVPTRNSASTLSQCLRSIREQDYAPIELIVVDNGSTDETRTIAHDFCDIVETYGPERSSQRNHGARLSQGAFLLFIDSDMRLSPRVVSDCVACIASTGAPAVIIPEVSTGEGFLARCRALERSCYRGDDSIEGARFFAREAFDQVEGFDEGLIAMEDWDLTARIAARRTLPRSRSEITHDEGRLTLKIVLAKKRYYASASVHYWRKHGRSALGQANLIFRPAFFRNWKRLLAHPVLTAGFLSLKAMEATAVAWEVVSTQIGGIGHFGANQRQGNP